MPYNKSNAVFVICGARGHLHAAFGLARRFQKLGVRAQFIVPVEASSTVESAGFEFAILDVLRTVRMPYGIARRPLDLIRNASLKDAVRAVRAGREEVRSFRESLETIRLKVLGLLEDRSSQLFIF